MDEPTSGMDALTKRLVWSNIQRKIAEGKTSVILTSHSMEECEVLCSRLAIMAHGQFVCLGSLSHLKQKYGRGYVVSIMFKSADDLHRGADIVQSSFDSNIGGLTKRNITLTFKVTDPDDCTPSTVFNFIQSRKKNLRIKDFSIQQTTLDEVFVSLAENHNSLESRRNSTPSPTESEA